MVAGPLADELEKAMMGPLPGKSGAEHAYSRLNRFGRLLVHWEKRADTYLAMLYLALGIITWRTCLSK